MCSDLLWNSCFNEKQAVLAYRAACFLVSCLAFRRTNREMEEQFQYREGDENAAEQLEQDK